VQIELTKTVAAQPPTAFATVANVVDWPEIISSIKSVELLTPAPIRAGSRLRERRTLFGRDGMHELMIATIERPHRLRLLVDHPDLHYELDHVIDALFGGGCRIMLIFRNRPETSAGKVLQDVMSPFMQITLRDELEQDLSDLASAVSRRAAVEL
jgi:polyketide cyclase/dehydrase/lipid transport protein